MMHMDVYVMPTNDTDHSCHKSHRTSLTNHMGSISHHNVPLVINSLRGGDTHTCIPTFVDRSNSKKPGVLGLKTQSATFHHDHNLYT